MSLPAQPVAPLGARRWAGPVLFALVVVVGVVLRFVARSPLWLDEALTANIAALPLREIPDALLRDGHPPLYYVLLHGWTSVVGDGDQAVRALSGVCSVATLPLVWLLGRRAGGRELGVAAVAVVALNPYVVRYATEARMYALVMLLVAAGALLLDDLLRRPGPVRALGVALVAGALLWTNYWGAYLLAVVGLSLVVAWVRRPQDRPALGWAIGAFGLGGLSFLPWVPDLLEQAERTGTPWAVAARPTQVAQATVVDLGGGGYAEGVLLGVALVVAAVLVVVDVRGVPDAPHPAPRLAPDRLLGWSVATLVVGSLGAIATSSAYAGRYAAVVVPFVLVAAAAGVLRARPRWVQAGLATLVLGLGLVASVHNAGVDRTQARTNAEVLAARATPDDLVVVCPDQLAPDLHRALRAEGVANDLLVYPALGDPRFVDWRDYAERNAAADPGAFAAEVLDRAGDRTVWVVWQGGYRTLIQQCETLVEALAVRRTGTVVQRNLPVFEGSSVWRFDG